MTIGHNLNSEQLLSIVQRIERLISEKDDVQQSIRDVYAEAKGNGYDVQTLRKVVKLRGMDAQKREEQESLLDTYKHALGMETLPLFGEES